MTNTTTTTINDPYNQDHKYKITFVYDKKENEQTTKLNIIIKKNRNNKEVAFKIVRSSGLLLKRRMKLDDAYSMLADGTARMAKDF